jgi:hypothetical protein
MDGSEAHDTYADFVTFRRWSSCQLSSFSRFPEFDLTRGFDLCIRFFDHVGTSEGHWHCSLSIARCSGLVAILVLFAFYFFGHSVSSWSQLVV